MALSIFVILAGLLGAAGVILAAAGAHAAPNAGLDGAAYMLFFTPPLCLAARPWRSKACYGDRWRSWF